MNRRKLNRKAIIVVPAMLLALTLSTFTSAGPGGSFAVPAAAAQTGQSLPFAPVGSGFTYQGQLKNGGSPANGQFDFQFKLFDALSGGTQVGSALTVANQTVSGGLFTVTLDFGATVFIGDARWLEIAVRTAGGGTYTTLSPRQPMTATPYAMSLMPGSIIQANSSSILVSVYNPGTGAGIFGGSGSGVGVRGNSVAQHGGLFTNNSTTGYAALQGIASGTPGYGVYGEGNSIGVWGSTTNGTGVRGATTGGYGVHGYSVSNGTGVRGESSQGSGVHGLAGGYGQGVRGTSNDGTGVYGDSSTGYGVHGNSTSSTGVFGFSSSGTGVYGLTDNSTGLAGVLGIAPANSYGVRGQGGIGVYGTTNANNGVGVRGDSSGGYGVHGVSTNASSWGVRGDSTNGGGVAGISTSNTGVYGTSGTGWAGWFDGNVNVTGGCCAAGRLTTQIDHPLDPQNKYLVQAAVQSPELKSVYDGNIVTNASGEATVTLPDYIEAFNADFRYQLTVVGQFARAIVSREIKGNRFTIKTDKPGVKVSWQVTGTRIDPYAKAHPIESEVNKPDGEQGKYQHPAEWGQPDSKGIDYEEQQRMQKMTPAPLEDRSTSRP